MVGVPVSVSVSFDLRLVPISSRRSLRCILSYCLLIVLSSSRYDPHGAARGTTCQQQFTFAGLRGILYHLSDARRNMHDPRAPHGPLLSCDEEEHISLSDLVQLRDSVDSVDDIILSSVRTIAFSRSSELISDCRFFAGEQFQPHPTSGLCTMQSALIYGAPVLWVASYVLQLHVL